MKLAEYYNTPVDVLQRIMSQESFLEAQAYYSLYPHWTERLEVYLAQIAFWVSNSIERKEGHKPPDFKEFIFDFEEIDKDKESGSNRQSSKAMEAVLKRAVKIYGKHQQNINVDNGGHDGVPQLDGAGSRQAPNGTERDRENKQ